MSAEQSVGERILRVRESRSVTREVLSERSGLETSFIARLEDGRVSPDLAPLVKIARALGVRLGTFLDDGDELGPVVVRSGSGRRAFRASGQASSPASGGSSTAAVPTSSTDGAASPVAFFSLAADKSGRHMEPFYLEISPEVPGSGEKNPTGAADSSSHEGEEFLYVLAGSAAVLYGKERFELEAGDSIYYDSIVPHRVISSGSGMATLIGVVYAPF